MFPCRYHALSYEHKNISKGTINAELNEGLSILYWDQKISFWALKMFTAASNPGGQGRDWLTGTPRVTNVQKQSATLIPGLALLSGC